jgi:hypothetical protein
MEMHHTAMLHPSENVGELLLHSSVSSDQYQTMTQTQSFVGQVKRSGSATVQYLHGFHCRTKKLLQSPASRTRSVNNNQKKILKNIINQKRTSESKSKAETKTMVDSDNHGWIQLHGNETTTTEIPLDSRGMNPSV